MSETKTEAKAIHQIVIRDGRSKTTYTKGGRLEIKDSNGDVVKRYNIANIEEKVEQYEQFKSHIIYIVSDEFGNMLVKQHAGSDNLTIICNPL